MIQKYFSIIAIFLIMLLGCTIGSDEKASKSQMKIDKSSAGFIVKENPPNFTWPKEADGETYWLLVGTSPDFDNGIGEILINNNGLSENSYVSKDKFIPGSYYWKVKYISGDPSSWYWSEIMSFTVVPDSEFEVKDNPPYFAWPGLEGVSYWLLVGTNGDFDNGNGVIIENEGNLQYNFFQSVQKYSPGTYFWKVKYKSGEFDNWFWSSTFSFVISADGEFEVTGNPPSYRWPLIEGAAYWLLSSTSNDFDNGGGILMEDALVSENLYQSETAYPPGKYFWKVKYKVGEFEEWYWSPTQEFTISSANAGYGVIGNPPCFKWPDDASSYWLLVSDNGDVGSGNYVINQGELSSNAYFSPYYLNPDTYFWKVKFKEGPFSDWYWSSIMEFTVENNGYCVDNDTNHPVFHWPEANNEGSFWIIVGTNPDFDNGGGENKINDGNVKDNFYVSTVQFNPGVYFWKVKYKIGDFSSWYWSPIYCFTID